MCMVSLAHDIVTFSLVLPMVTVGCQSASVYNIKLGSGSKMFQIFEKKLLNILFLTRGVCKPPQIEGYSFVGIYQL